MEFDQSSSPYRLRGPHDNERKDPFVERLLHPASMDFIRLMEEKKRISASSPRESLDGKLSARSAPDSERQNNSDSSRKTPTHDQKSVQRISYDAGLYPDLGKTKEETVSGFASLPYLTLGTALQTVPTALDRASIKSTTVDPNSLLGIWAKHSKNAKEYQTLIDGIQNDSKLYRAATIQIDANRPKILELEQKVQRVLENLHAKEKAGSTSRLIPKRIEFLTDFIKNPNSDALESALGNGEEVKGFSKVFLRDGKDATLLKEYANISRANEEPSLNKALATQRIRQAEEAAAKLSTRVDELAKSQLRKGLLYSGGSICTGYAIDGFLGTMLGYEPKNNPVRLFFDGVVVPAAIQAPLGRFKPIVVIAAESIARLAAAAGL